jgi:hypothetical protein
VTCQCKTDMALFQLQSHRGISYYRTAVAARQPQMLRTVIAVRVQVEIMGPGKYENVGNSQSVLIMTNPIIFTRTRSRRGEASWGVAEGRLHTSASR